jgi:hypothetical protein
MEIGRYPKVINPKHLNESMVTGEVIKLGAGHDYKPNIGVFPDGEMILLNLHQHYEEVEHGAVYCMHTVMFRSKDGGRTWERGKHLPFEGHEPSITITGDGTVFVITHSLPREPFNSFGNVFTNIYRSEDRGATFSRYMIKYTDFPGSQPEDVIYSRNIFQLDPETLILGITKKTEDYLFSSKDNGKTWSHKRVSYKGVDIAAKQHFWGLMPEAVIFRSPRGRLMMLSRVDLGKLVFDADVPHIYKMEKSKAIDSYEGLLLFESVNGGTEWKVLRGVGYPGMMYPGVVVINRSEMLLNFTVRALLEGCSDSVYPHMGVQATIIKERDDGGFDIDLKNDLIVIDDKTDSRVMQGGGFGRTVMLQDGSFVTPYSYKWTDQDVIDGVESKVYLDKEKFEKMNDALGMGYYYDEYSYDDEILKSIYIDSFCAAIGKSRFKTEVLKWSIKGR